MTYPLKYLVQAERDLTDINSYYNKITPTLTDKFFEEFFETLKYIKNEPQIFQVRYRNIRIAPLYRFPYGIHYRQTGDLIIILRVLHTKRYFR